MSFRRNQLSTLSALAIVIAFVAPLRAADWPTRPVSVIVPFGAGGNTDMMARLGTQRLTAKFGQTFVVENRPSAGGALGTGQVATAAPDGYTLLFCASANINLTPQLQKLNFDPVKQSRADHQRRDWHADHRDQAILAGHDAAGIHRLRKDTSRKAQLHRGRYAQDSATPCA